MNKEESRKVMKDEKQHEKYDRKDNNSGVSRNQKNMKIKLTFTKIQKE